MAKNQISKQVLSIIAMNMTINYLKNNRSKTILFKMRIKAVYHKGQEIVVI